MNATKSIWYLSFADDDNGGNLGIVIVDDARDIADASRMAHAAGCNPGGEVFGWEISPDSLARIGGEFGSWMLTAPRLTLLQREDLPFACVNSNGEPR